MLALRYLSISVRKVLSIDARAGNVTFQDGIPNWCKFQLNESGGITTYNIVSTENIWSLPFETGDENSSWTERGGANPESHINHQPRFTQLIQAKTRNRRESTSRVGFLQLPTKGWAVRRCGNPIASMRSWALERAMGTQMCHDANSTHKKRNKVDEMNGLNLSSSLHTIYTYMFPNLS